MDLQKLKVEHPAVYAAAMQDGQEVERDRVSAHLTMGKASGDMATAMTAVKDGSLMTASLQATYMAAGMNRRDTEDRQDDETDVSAAANNADNSDNADAGTTVADLVESRLGITGEA